jgi:hypothetical protein
MQRIVEGTAPPKFSIEHLKGLGFTSSNDRAIIPLLKDLGFLAEDGTPTKRYHDYRDTSKSRQVMGEALREAYEDLFHISARPTVKDRGVLEGKLKSTHNVSDRLAEVMATTFFALLKLADISQVPAKKAPLPIEKEAVPKEVIPPKKAVEDKVSPTLRLRYNIEVHLPATKDIEVYNAIFKSLREHLLD